MSMPDEHDVLRMINDPNISPWRTENDQLMVTENGDFIVFSVGNIRNWNARLRGRHQTQAYRWRY